jgi:hypothetical protein
MTPRSLFLALAIGAAFLASDVCAQAPDPANSTWSWIGAPIKVLCPQGDKEEVQINYTLRNAAGAPVPNYPGSLVCIDHPQIVGCGTGPDSICGTTTDPNGNGTIKFNEAGYNSLGECAPVICTVGGVTFNIFASRKIRFLDQNGDCLVDSTDANIVINHYGTAAANLFVDFDNDSNVCNLDLNYLLVPHYGHSGFAPHDSPQVSETTSTIDLAWDIVGSGPWSGGGNPPPAWANGLQVQGQGTQGSIIDVGAAMKVINWSGVTLTGSNPELGAVTITQSGCGCTSVLKSLSPTGVPFFPAMQANYFYCNVQVSLPEAQGGGTTTFENHDPIELVAQVDGIPAPNIAFAQVDPVKLFALSDPNSQIQFHTSEFLEPTTTAIGNAPDVSSDLRIQPWSPSPFGHTTTLSFELGRGALISLRIYDAQGRIRRQLVDQAFKDAGLHELAWDGTDDRGHPVPAGTYFFRLDAGLSGRSSGSVTLLR